MRKKKNDPGSKKSAWASAAGWVRKRRENVATAVANDGPVVGPIPRRVGKLASKMWSKAHQKEFDRSALLERKRRYFGINSTIVFRFPSFELDPINIGVGSDRWWLLEVMVSKASSE